MTAPATRLPGELTPAEHRQAWQRTWLLFALATALLIGMYYDSVVSMVRIWSVSDTFGYGFLILPIVIYLTFLRRRQLAALVPQPWFWALLWIAGALLVQLVGTIGNALLLSQLAFVALWQGLFALLTGWPVVRRMFFPLFFLYFAVPMGEEIVPLLQTVTAEIAVFLLRGSGIPTYHSGILIEIPSASFVVADVCSGVRFLITTVVLGALAANLFFRSWRRRLLFMLLCLVVPILANGARAYGTIMLAHLVDLRLAITADHIIYGLIFLSVVLLILTGVGALFRDRWPHEEDAVPPAPAKSMSASRLSSAALAVVLAAVLLGGGKAWSLQISGPPTSAAAVDLAALQPGAGWSLADGPPADWEPAFPGADMSMLRSYRETEAEGEVAFFIAHYLYQRSGHEIIAPGNSFIGRNHSRQVTRFEEVEVPLGGRTLTIRETEMALPQGTHVIWSWYDIGGNRTTSPTVGKLLEIWQGLSGGSRAATAFALFTPADENLPLVRARLEVFLSDLAESGGLAAAQAESAF